MKKIILIILLFLDICVNAQDRRNLPNYVFDAKSQAITVGKFWLHNGMEWESTTNNSTKWFGSKGRNFVSIRLNRLTLDTVKYYVLIDRYWGGYYEYPSINVGWHDYQKVCALTFNEKEIKKLRNIENNKVIALEILSEYEDYFQSQWTSYSDRKNISYIKDNLQERASSDSVMVKKTIQSGQAVIRLIIPDGIWLNDFEKAYIEISFSEFKKLFSVII